MNFLLRFLLTPLLLSAVFVGSGLWTLHTWLAHEHHAWGWLTVILWARIGIGAFYTLRKCYCIWLTGGIILLACLPLARYAYEYYQSCQLDDLLDAQGNLIWIEGIVNHAYPVSETSNFRRYQVRLNQLTPQHNENRGNHHDSLPDPHLTQTTQKIPTDIFLSLSVKASEGQTEANMLMIGDHIQCLASVRAIKSPASPFDFDFQHYAYSQGVRNQAHPLSPLITSGLSGNLMLRAKAKLHDYRAWVKKRLSLGVDTKTPAYQLMLPLVLGIKNAETTQALQSFKSLGLLHLFAISGLHLGLMLYLVNRLSLMAKLPYSLRYLAIFALLLYYTLITGWAPSIMRTSIFLLIWGIAQVRRLPFRPLNSLCATFIISLAINPYQLFQVGFQLSFSIVLALIFMAKLWQKYAQNLAKPDAYIPVKFWRHDQRWFFIYGQKLGQSFGVSLFAFVASSGFMMYYFGAAYGWSILLTPLFIPLISIEIFITCLMLVILPWQHDRLQTKANQMHLWYLQKLHQSAQRLNAWLPHASIEVSSYKQPQLWLMNAGFHDHLVGIDQERLHLFPQSSASLNSMQQLYTKLTLYLPENILAQQPVIHLNTQHNPHHIDDMPGLISRNSHYLSHDNFSVIESTLFYGLSAIEITHVQQPVKILYLAQMNDSIDPHITYVNELSTTAYQAIIIHSSWNQLHPDFVAQLRELDTTMIIEQATHGAIQIIGNKENFHLRGFISQQTWKL